MCPSARKSRPPRCASQGSPEAVADQAHDAWLDAGSCPWCAHACASFEHIVWQFSTRPAAMPVPADPLQAHVG